MANVPNSCRLVARARAHALVLGVPRFELLLVLLVGQRLRRMSTYVYFLVFFGLGLLFVLMSGGAFSTASVVFPAPAQP